MPRERQPVTAHVKQSNPSTVVGGVE
jgi:hypothetical protein